MHNWVDINKIYLFKRDFKKYPNCSYTRISQKFI